MLLITKHFLTQKTYTEDGAFGKAIHQGYTQWTYKLFGVIPIFIIRTY